MCVYIILCAITINIIVQSYHNSLKLLSSGASVYGRHLISPASSRKTKFSPFVENLHTSQADTASIYSIPSMLSLHSLVDGGSSRLESERGTVCEQSSSLLIFKLT